MNRRGLLISLLLALAWIPARARPGYAILTGSIINPTSDSVFVYGYTSPTDYVKGKHLIKGARLDKEGKFFLSFKWPKGNEFELRNGETYLLYQVFLCPGDSISMNFTANKFEADGKGADQIEFSMSYADSFYLAPKEREKYSKSFGALRMDSFTAYIDDRHDRSLGFLKTFLGGKDYCPEFETYALNEIDFKWAVDKFQYLWRYNYSRKIAGNLKVDPSYFSFAEKLKTLRARYSTQYYSFLNEFVDAVWCQYLQRLPEKKKKTAYKNQYFKKAQIADSLFSGNVRDIAYALIVNGQIRGLQSQMDKKGVEVKIESDSLLKIFHSRASSPLWFEFAKAQAESALSMQGRTAPDFRLLSNEGDSISLSSLKGTVVLLDFWATNCNPCLKAIPESNGLQEKLKGKAFVMVSICCDPDRQAEWKKILIQKKWQGIHLLYSRQSGLMEKYDIHSYPRYILIDKAGKIISVDSPGPGANLEKEILSLLEK